MKRIGRKPRKRRIDDSEVILKDVTHGTIVDGIKGRAKV